MSELLAQVWHYSQLGLGVFQVAALVIGTIYCLIQTIRRPDQDHDEPFSGVLGNDGKKTRRDGNNSAEEAPAKSR